MTAWYIQGGAKKKRANSDDDSEDEKPKKKRKAPAGGGKYFFRILTFRGTAMTVDVVLCDLPLDRLACLIHNDPL